MKKKFIDLYMDFAYRVAKLSHARRLQVGSVIVKDDTVISYGYNGMPAGWDNDCEHTELMPNNAGEYLDPAEIITKWPFEGRFWVGGQEVITRYRLKTKPEVLHAESNSISKLAKSTNSGLNADMFITHSPCVECAKLIYQSGINRVFYSENYRDNHGVEFLQNSGVQIEKV